MEIQIFNKIKTNDFPKESDFHSFVSSCQICVYRFLSFFQKSKSYKDSFKKAIKSTLNTVASSTVLLSTFLPELTFHATLCKIVNVIIQ